MRYSQKYCIVSFIQPIPQGTQFSMSNWPLHITLADVFAIDTDATNIEQALSSLLSRHTVLNVSVNKEATLGTTDVVLLSENLGLLDLHIDIVTLLESFGAKFNTPEFTRDGFLPHCTIQKTERLHPGDKITINQASLIDMFPNDNWQQRRVLTNFNLQT